MEQLQCGLLSWRPGFLQRFRHPKYYVATFFLILLFKDASGAFFIGMRIPIGDLFDMTSFQFQIISAISNLGAVPVFLMHPFINYFPKKTLWIYVGVMLSALGHLVTALPGVISEATDPAVAYRVMLLGYFIYGLGSTTVTFLSLAYIDDNVDHKKSPAYVGVALTGTVVAQISGFGLSYFLQRPDPDLSWWYGFVIFAIGQVFFAQFIILFPSQIRDQEVKTRKKLKFWPIVQKYGGELKRVFTRKVFLLAFFSYILILAAVQGFRTNVMIFVVHMYQEDEDAITPFLGGTVLGTAMTTSLLGLVIKKYQIPVRKLKRQEYLFTHYSFQLKRLTIWNIVVLLLSLASLFLLYCKGCHNTPFAFPDKMVFNNCSTCEDYNISAVDPFVCTEDRTLMFRSPCRAGCDNGTLTNCSCVKMLNLNSTVLTKGRCPATKECGDYFYVFGFMLVFFPCLLASGPFGVSKYLTIMRSVEDRDKEVAIMLAQVGGQLLALIPSPPIFGLILDNTCRERDVAGRENVCNLYDKDLMKRDFYLGVSILLFVVLMLEVLLFWHSDRIQLYEEQSPGSVEKAGTMDESQQETMRI